MSKITYDPDARASYIKISDAAIENTSRIDRNVNIDFDKCGGIVGIELIGYEIRSVWDSQPEECPYTFAHTKHWCGREGCRDK